MQVISQRALYEFYSLHPQHREPMLAWLRLMSAGEYMNFEASRHTFGSAEYRAPYTVFRIGRCDARVIAVVHYIRRCVFVRHVLTQIEYEDWLTRVNRKRAIGEALSGVAYAVDSSGVARVAGALSGEVVHRYERASWQSDERILE